VNADGGEKFLPTFRTYVRKRPPRRKVTIRRVEMIDRRKRTFAAYVREASPDILLRHILPDRRNVFHDVPVTVNDPFAGG
jgi:hypothetical protein